MPIDDTVLYEDFVRAREEAVELTDRYRNSPADAPNRDQLWDRVVVQTETARLLLESWLTRQRPHSVAEDAGYERRLEALSSRT
jgi:hypothetical protein